MSGVTAAGLPYPTAQDPLADTDRYIRELDAAAMTRARNRPIVMKSLVAPTNASGQATLTFPEFSHLAGLVILTAYAGTLPLVCNVLAFGGRDAVVLFSMVYAGTGANTTGPLASNYVNCTVIAWGTPV